MKKQWRAILLFSLCAGVGNSLHAEDTVIWRLGTFDGSEADLTPVENFSGTVYVVAQDPAADFPNQHSPPDDDFNPDNANEINVYFEAPSGDYRLRVGQLATIQPETVTLSLDGSPIGSYTTSTSNKIHEIALTLSGQEGHELTFEEFFGNNGYRFDAVELVTEVEGLIVYPEDVIFSYGYSTATLTVYGGIGEYKVSTTGPVEANMSSPSTVLVRPGSTTGRGTVVVEDQVANYVEVPVSVYDSEIKPTEFDPSDNSLEIPSIAVTGDTSGGTFNASGTLYSENDLMELLFGTDAGLFLYLVITNVSEN